MNTIVTIIMLGSMMTAGMVDDAFGREAFRDLEHPAAEKIDHLVVERHPEVFKAANREQKHPAPEAFRDLGHPAADVKRDLGHPAADVKRDLEHPAMPAEAVF